MKRNRIFFLFIGILAVIVAIAALIWNRPPESVAGKTGKEITATQLAEDFETDETKANRRYLNQVLEVTGTISEITKNQDGQQVLLLESNNPLSGVQCSMKEEKTGLQPGQTVIVKGFCNGYTSVVLLSDCVFVNP